jgi:hypothetical protein
LADAGGVFVSNTVYDHVRDRLPFVFEDLGEKQVKNIARPVRVYRIPIAEIAPAKKLIKVGPQTLVSPCSWPSGSETAAFGPCRQAYPVAQAPATVIMIDDDLSVREALGSLLRSWARKQICMARCRSS